MGRLASFALLATTLAVSACGDDRPVTCRGSDAPTLSLGQGVGGAFVDIVDDQEVGLASAPQGGFGVTVLVRTTGLEVGKDDAVTFQLDVEVDGQPAGDFKLERLVACQDDGSGGVLNGVVVGFDPIVYASNDDLLALHQKVATLVVTATDVDGRTITVRKPVTIIVGGA